MKTLLRVGCGQKNTLSLKGFSEKIGVNYVLLQVKMQGQMLWVH